MSNKFVELVKALGCDPGVNTEATLRYNERLTETLLTEISDVLVAPCYKEQEAPKSTAETLARRASLRPIR
jgi:hypothetical protein